MCVMMRFGVEMVCLGLPTGVDGWVGFMGYDYTMYVYRCLLNTIFVSSTRFTYDCALPRQ